MLRTPIQNNGAGRTQKNSPREIVENIILSIDSKFVREQSISSIVGDVQMNLDRSLELEGLGHLDSLE
jgi:hypothetical protein